MHDEDATIMIALFFPFHFVPTMITLVPSLPSIFKAAYLPI